MTLKELTKVLSQLEGKKKEVSVGNLREIVGILSDLLKANPGLSEVLLKNGERRAKKKK